TSFLSRSPAPPAAHSFPTRRSSDLFRSPRLYAHVLLHGVLTWLLVWDAAFWAPALVLVVSHYCIDLTKVAFQRPDNRPRWFAIRSEEHTSELQSRENLVCRLLLAKK